MLLRSVTFATRWGLRTLAIGLGSLSTLLQSGNEEAWLVRARAHGSFGQEDDAVAVTRVGLRRLPESVKLRIDLADRLIFQGKVEEARQVLTDLPPAARDSPGALSALAHAAWREGDFTSARELSLEARRLLRQSSSDHDVEVLIGIASLLAEIPGAREDALETLRMSVEARPHEPWPHLILAALLAEIDDAAAADHAEQARACWSGGQKRFDSAMEMARTRVRKAT